MKNATVRLLATTILVAVTGPALAQTKVKLEPVVTGLNAPLAMVQVPGDDRIFVIEQWGRVMIVQNGELIGTPFLDIRNQVIDRYPDFDERGLLGLAFHPDYANNGKFYVAYSTNIDFQGDLGKQFWWDHSNIVSEFTVSADDPNVANRFSERILSSIPWPQFNHNGHWIGFGPDRMLYISTGDGGYANDWGIGHNPRDGNGQDLTSPQRQDPAHRPRDRRGGSRQPVRRKRGRRSTDLGLRPAQPLALLFRHGRRQRAVLRRRAAELDRGGQHHQGRRQLRLAPDGG